MGETVTRQKVQNKLKMYNFEVLEFTDGRSKMKVRDKNNDKIEYITLNKLQEKIRLTNRKMTPEALKENKLKKLRNLLMHIILK